MCKKPSTLLFYQITQKFDCSHNSILILIIKEWTISQSHEAFLIHGINWGRIEPNPQAWKQIWQLLRKKTQNLVFLLNLGRFVLKIQHYPSNNRSLWKMAYIFFNFLFYKQNPCFIFFGFDLICTKIEAGIGNFKTATNFGLYP